jgi:chromate transport protein ChrA
MATTKPSPPSPPAADEINAPRLSPLAAFSLFFGFGLRAFGGPVAQINMMREELVTKGRWISDVRFNRVLGVYQILPGPEATEMACYFGLIAGGRLNGVLAGLGFIAPGFLLMLLFSWLYMRFGVEDATFRAVFSAIQPAVCAMVFRAAHKIGEAGTKNPLTKQFDPALGLLGVMGAFQSVLNVNFFITKAHLALLYLALKRATGAHRESLDAAKAAAAADAEAAGLDAGAAAQSDGKAEAGSGGPAGTPADFAVVAAGGGGGAQSAAAQRQPLVAPSSDAAAAARSLSAAKRAEAAAKEAESYRFYYLSWAAAVLPTAAYIASIALVGPMSQLVPMGVGVAKALGNTYAAHFVVGLIGGLVTFGGAYTAVPFMQFECVSSGHWIANRVFLDSLAVSSLLPTPMVMFVTLVGFAAGTNANLGPGAGAAGAALMTLGMFLPAFVMPVLFHDFFEAVAKNRGVVADVLDSMTATVVGLVAYTGCQLLRSSVTRPTDAVIFAAATTMLYYVPPGMAGPHKYTPVFVIFCSALAGVVLYGENTLYAGQ